MATRLMLADDHRMLREGLRRSMIDHGFDVVGEARDGAEAVRLAGDLRPDVILMNVTMPEMDGVEATRQIKTAYPDVSVVMLTMHADPTVLAQAMRVGANGYLVKDSTTDAIAEAVREVDAGQTPLSPQLAAITLEAIRRINLSVGSGKERIFTERETEIVALVANGRSTGQIAGRLSITQETVTSHLSSAYQKLDELDRNQAVWDAIRAWGDEGGGLAGVREPRRPIPSNDSGSMRRDPPTA